MNKSMNCRVCDKEFIYKFKPSKNRKYCSVPCQIIGQKDRTHERIRRNCKFCNIEFVYKRCNSTNIYCSSKCKQIASRYTQEQKFNSVKRYFEKHIVKQEGCWDWTGGVSSNGYGQLGSGRTFKINHHRFSWILHNGPIPDGMHVLHHCDNRKCANPEHLFIGTHKDNIDDMWKKSRNAGQFKKGLVPHNKKTTPEIEQKIKEYIGAISRKALSEKFNLSIHVINRIIDDMYKEKRRLL